MNTKNFKYWAFISYSSKDKKWGQWLHRRLENYSIPKDFQGLELDGGVKIGKNLRPIFRDRDELSSSAELSESINEALTDSRYLIVLCSKNSAKSQWVNKEIEDFKALSPENEKRILALILDGEPNASSNNEILNTEECFPAALQYPLEPLAGDLRKDGDGKERGLLKILAGVSQIGFDKLYKRHERAQRKKRLFLGFIVVSIMLLLSGITLFALKQKNVAEQQTKIATQQQKQAKEALDESLLRTSETILERSRLVNTKDDPLLAAIIASRIINQKSPNNTNKVNSSNSLQTALLKKEKYPWLYQQVENQIEQTFNKCLPLLWSSVNTRHCNHPITDVMYAKDKELLITSNNSIINLWDIKTGLLKKTIRTSHSARILSLATNHNETLIASTSIDNTIRVWDTETGGQIGSTIFGHYGPVHSVIFSQNSDYLITSGEDKTIKTWDIQNQFIQLDSKSFHQDVVVDMTMSKDCKFLYSADGKKKIVRWQFSNGRLTSPKIIGEHDDIRTICISPDSTKLASADQNGQILIWNLDTLKYSNLKSKAVFSRIYDISFTKNDRVVYSTADGRLMAWNIILNTTRCVNPEQLKDSSLYFAYNPDKNLIYTGGKNGVISIRDSVTFELKNKNANGHSNSVDKTKYSNDGNLIVSLASNGNLIIWDTKRLQKVGCSSYLRRENVTSFDFSADSQKIIVAEKGRISIRNLSSNNVIGSEIKILNKYDELGTVKFIKYSPDNKYFAACLSCGTVKIYEVLTNNIFKVLVSEKNNEVTNISWRPDSDKLAIAYNASNTNIVKIYDVNEPSNLREIILPSYIQELEYSPSGRYLMLLSNGIQLWDSAKNKIRTFLPSESKKELSSIDISSCESTICVGDNAGYIRIYNLHTGGVILPSTRAHSGRITSVNYSPCKRRLLTSSSDATLKIWDLSYNADICANISTNDTLLSYESKITDLKFNSSDTELIGSTYESEVETSNLILFDRYSLKPTSFPFAAQKYETMLFETTKNQNEIIISNGLSYRVVNFTTMKETYSSRIATKDKYLPHCVSISKDKTIILSGGFNGLLNIEDTKEGQYIVTPFKSKAGKGIKTTINAVDISPQNKSVSYGGSDGFINIYDLKNSLLKISFPAHSEAISNLKFSPDGKVLFSSSYDNKFKVWNVSDWSLSQSFDLESEVTSIEYSKDSKLIAIIMGLHKSSHLVLLSLADLEYVTEDEGGCIAISNSEDRYVTFLPMLGILKSKSYKSNKYFNIFDYVTYDYVTLESNTLNWNHDKKRSSIYNSQYNRQLTGNLAPLNQHELKSNNRLKLLLESQNWPQLIKELEIFKKDFKQLDPAFTESIFKSFIATTCYDIKTGNPRGLVMINKLDSILPLAQRDTVTIRLLDFLDQSIKKINNPKIRTVYRSTLEYSLRRNNFQKLLRESINHE